MVPVLVVKTPVSNVFMYGHCMTYSLPQVDKLSLGLNWDHGRAEDNVGLPAGTV